MIILISLSVYKSLDTKQEGPAPVCETARFVRGIFIVIVRRGKQSQILNLIPWYMQAHSLIYPTIPVISNHIPWGEAINYKKNTVKLGWFSQLQTLYVIQPHYLIYSTTFQFLVHILILVSVLNLLGLNCLVHFPVRLLIFFRGEVIFLWNFVKSIVFSFDKN